MLKVWKLQISLFGIFFGAVIAEVTILPSLWAPLRVDFLIGMIVGMVIYLPFSQGFPFVVIASLVIEAFSGARIGLIPLLYIAVFLAMDLLKELIYLENIVTQAILSAVFYAALAGALALLTNTSLLGDAMTPLLVGMGITALISPIMVFLVNRLQVKYGIHEP